MTMIKKRKRERKEIPSIRRVEIGNISRRVGRLSVGKINDGCTECVIHVTGES